MSRNMSIPHGYPEDFDFTKLIEDLERRLDHYENSVDEQLKFINKEVTRMSSELDNLKNNDNSRLRELEIQVVSLADRISNIK